MPRLDDKYLALSIAILVVTITGGTLVLLVSPSSNDNQHTHNAPNQESHTTSITNYNNVTIKYRRNQVRDIATEHLSRVPSGLLAHDTWVDAIVTDAVLGDSDTRHAAVYNRLHAYDATLNSEEIKLFATELLRYLDERETATRPAIPEDTANKNSAIRQLPDAVAVYDWCQLQWDIGDANGSPIPDDGVAINKLAADKFNITEQQADTLYTIGALKKYNLPVPAELYKQL